MTEEPRRPSRFFTIEQAAQELNVGVPLIRGMLRTGELRGIQVGGRGVWRIGIADVESYVEQAYRRAAEKIFRGDFTDEETAEAMAADAGASGTDSPAPDGPA